MTIHRSVCLALSATAMLAWCRPGAALAADDPRLARKLYTLVKPMLDGDKREQALPFLEQALKADPSFYPAALAAARIHHRAGRADKARAYYTLVRRILVARKRRSPAEERDLAEATAGDLDDRRPRNEIEEVTLPALRQAHALCRLFEQQRDFYHALRTMRLSLAIDDKDPLMRARYADLQRRAPPAVTFAAMGLCPTWRSIFNGKNLDGWNRYGGPWQVRGGMLRLGRMGRFYLFRDNHWHRDFVLQARVRLSWGGYCYLLGRARVTGTFYACGVRLAQNYDWERHRGENRRPVATAWRCRDWQVKYLAGQDPIKKIEVEDDKWYRLRLVFRDKRLVFQIDEHTVFDVETDSPTAGTVGLAGCGGNDDRFVYLRDVVVRDLCGPSRAPDNTPHSPTALSARAKQAEAGNKTAEAVGYYHALLACIDEDTDDPDLKRMARDAAKRLRIIDKAGEQVAQAQKQLTRALERLAGKWKKREQLDQALPAYSILCRVEPRKQEWRDALYRVQALRAMGGAEKTPRGYRSLLNHVDLRGLEIIDGYWRVCKGVLVGDGWGTLVLADRYYDYRLRMCYRSRPPQARAGTPNSLLIHQNPDPKRAWVRAELLLAGPDTGMVTRLTPPTKYTQGEDEDMHMLTPRDFREDEWINLALTVKGTRIRVKLNNKLVFESSKSTQINGYEDRHQRDFPGRLALRTRGQRLEVRSLFFDPGKRAK